MNFCSSKVLLCLPRMTSEKPAMERLLFGRDLPVGEQEALPVAGWRDSFGHAVVDGSEKDLIEISDAVEDRCYVLRSWTCRTRALLAVGLTVVAAEMLACVCRGTVEVHSVRVGQQHPDPIHG